MAPDAVKNGVCDRLLQLSRPATVMSVIASRAVRAVVLVSWTRKCEINSSQIGASTLHEREWKINHAYEDGLLMRIYSFLVVGNVTEGVGS